MQGQKDAFQSFVQQAIHQYRQEPINEDFHLEQDIKKNVARFEEEVNKWENRPNQQQMTKMRQVLANKIRIEYKQKNYKKRSEEVLRQSSIKKMIALYQHQLNLLKKQTQNSINRFSQCIQQRIPQIMSCLEQVIQKITKFLQAEPNWIQEFEPVKKRLNGILNQTKQIKKEQQQAINKKLDEQRENFYKQSIIQIKEAIKKAQTLEVQTKSFAEPQDNFTKELQDLQRKLNKSLQLIKQCKKKPVFSLIYNKRPQEDNIYQFTNDMDKTPVIKSQQTDNIKQIQELLIASINTTQRIKAQSQNSKQAKLNDIKKLQELKQLVKQKTNIAIKNKIELNAEDTQMVGLAITEMKKRARLYRLNLDSY